MHLDASMRSRELEEIRKRDHDELVEMMTRIQLATSTSQLATTVTPDRMVRSAPPPLSTAPNPPPSSSLLSRGQLSVDSSSSPSTSSTSEWGIRRLLSIGSSYMRSQTTPDTSPSVNCDLLSPSTPPSRPRTTPTEKVSKMAPPQLSRSATAYIILSQSRKWEPISPVVLDRMQKVASDSECLLRPATDGTVLAGNLEGFVSRVISDTADPSRSDRFGETFLTIYQLFATSEQLFRILKRRFESTDRGPATVRSRYS
jgi:hypothetical protein